MRRGGKLSTDLLFAESEKPTKGIEARLSGRIWGESRINATKDQLLGISFGVAQRYDFGFGWGTAEDLGSGRVM